MTDPFSESLDLLAGDDNTPFAEFSIDSDEEEELNKFINGDVEEDDPLGIFDFKIHDPPRGQHAVAEQKDKDDIVVNVEATSSEVTGVTTSANQSLANYTPVPVLVPAPLLAPVVDNNDFANGDSASPTSSAAENSMQKSNIGSDSSASVTVSTSTSVSTSVTVSAVALKKQSVAAMEDPLSLTWTNPIPDTTPMTNDYQSENGVHLPYPNISHTTAPMPTSTPMAPPSAMGVGGHMGEIYNAADLSSTASAGMASLVSKTQSLTSTFSSFASKFQDVVSSAATNANISVKPMNHKQKYGHNHNHNHTMKGMNASIQSNVPLSGNHAGYAHAHGHAQQSMHGINSGMGAMGVGNFSDGMHGNPATGILNAPNGNIMYGAQNVMNGNDNGNMNGINGGLMAAKIPSRAQDIDKVKRGAILHSAIGSLLPGEAIILFISNLRDVKETSSPHTNVGTAKLYRDGAAEGDEKWCCAMTLYRIILFSFRESEFIMDDRDQLIEGTEKDFSPIKDWVHSASVSRQFQCANQHRNVGGRFHQVIQMPIGAIDRVEKTTDSVSNSSQIGFASSSLIGNSTLYVDNLGGSVANETLIIYGKDNGRFIQFTTPSYECGKAYQHLNEYAFPGKQRLGFLFAFESRKAEVIASVKEAEIETMSMGNPAGRVTSRATPRRYDALTEFQRMVSISPDMQCPWRPLLKVNATYNICGSYPSIVFGPSCVNDETPEGMGIIQEIAAFRSGHRFQTLSWASQHDGASLWRCAQPKVGIQGNRDSTDERYIKMIGECAALANSQAVASGKMPPRPSVDFLRMLTGGINGSDLMLESYGRSGAVALNAKCMVKIMDLRPKSSAMANRTAGYGYENTSYYKNTTLSFHGIGNIHAVRDSYQKLNALCANPTANDVQWMQLVEETKWLSMVRLILSASWQAAFHVRYNRLPVLLHCSHGWDRTSQVCALSQIFLDPYYRTRAGFSCLVEKDFLALGHPFHLRSRHGEGRGDRNNASASSQVDEGQMSPIFIQFLDCVWQIVNQYPDFFEFNSKYMLVISEHVYSCRFGTLLCDTEKEREVAASIRQRTPCLWEYLDSSPELVNRSYRPERFQEDKCENGSLMMPLSCLLRNVTLWTDRFCMYSSKPTDRCLPPEMSSAFANLTKTDQVIGRVGRYDDLELERVQADVTKWKAKDEEIFSLKQKLKAQEMENHQLRSLDIK